MRGAILWTQLSSTDSIIAIVIKANGHQAFADILFPLPRKGEKLLIDTQRVEGAYLQQLLGPPVVEFDETFREKKIHPITGLVVPHHDKNGCMRMSTQGPDIGIVPASCDNIPIDVMAQLGKDPFATNNNSPLPLNPDNGKPIPVLYIHRPREPENYKFVQTYLRERDITDDPETCFYSDKVSNSKMESKPTYSVPIGRPISTSSERYVSLC
jgi:hypothetical protein